MAIKARLFSHLLHGDDEDAIRVYLWHIVTRRQANLSVGVGMDANKATDAEYVPQAAALLASMVEKGFDPAFPIPIDPNGELLGGAHRVACALALGVEEVPVERKAQMVWAPAWGEQWFTAHGCLAEDLERIRRDWTALTIVAASS